MRECVHKLDVTGTRLPVMSPVSAAPISDEPPRNEPIKYALQCMLCGEWIVNTKEQSGAGK